MPRLTAWALLALLAATLDAGEARATACVAVRAEARYVAYAYNHIVHLDNVCDGAQVCTVATDVSPTPQAVTVPGRSAVEVLTFRGSPARVFVPAVACTEAGS